ncbi:unnamed protein product, partial [Protopolystoma xenopodis]
VHIHPHFAIDQSAFDRIDVEIAAYLSQLGVSLPNLTGQQPPAISSAQPVNLTTAITTSPTHSSSNAVFRPQTSSSSRATGSTQTARARKRRSPDVLIGNSQGNRGVGDASGQGESSSESEITLPTTIANTGSCLSNKRHRLEQPRKSGTKASEDDAELAGEEEGEVEEEEVCNGEDETEDHHTTLNFRSGRSPCNTRRRKRGRPRSTPCELPGTTRHKTWCTELCPFLASLAWRDRICCSHCPSPFDRRIRLDPIPDLPHGPLDPFRIFLVDRFHSVPVLVFFLLQALFLKPLEARTLTSLNRAPRF